MEVDEAISAAQEPAAEVPGARWTMKTVVAGNGFNGPDFFFCIIDCTSDNYENGDHYDRAKAEAREHGYEGEMVAFDEIDGPAGLFALFEWASASTFVI